MLLRKRTKKNLRPSQPLLLSSPLPLTMVVYVQYVCFIPSPAIKNLKFRPLPLEWQWRRTNKPAYTETLQDFFNDLSPSPPPPSSLLPSFPHAGHAGREVANVLLLLSEIIVRGTEEEGGRILLLVLWLLASLQFLFAEKETLLDYLLLLSPLIYLVFCSY